MVGKWGSGHSRCGDGTAGAAFPAPLLSRGSGQLCTGLGPTGTAATMLQTVSTAALPRVLARDISIQQTDIYSELPFTRVLLGLPLRFPSPPIRTGGCSAPGIPQMTLPAAFLPSAPF